MISSSLMITPPAPPSKRQRSRESRALSGRPGSTYREADDGPPPSPGLRIPAFLNQTKADVGKLFQELEWRQRFRLQHALNHPNSSPFRIGRSPIVFSRNRYGNVQPWDDLRIRLKRPIGGSDYVNASPITLTSRPASSTPNPDPTAAANEQSTSTSINLSESKYIATQGPKDGQFSHFWNMVMQETVGETGVIVMLTPCWEGNKEKCGQYFPASMDMPVLYLEPNQGNDSPSNPTGDPFLDSDPLSADADSDPAEDSGSDRNTPDPPSEFYPPGTVTLLDFHHDTKSRSEVRKLRLQIRDETKTIFHYLFNGWPDYGKPEGEDRRALLELIKQSALQAGDPGLDPRFIHCSAGVGRTGTFITLDHLLRELAHGKLEVIPSSSRPGSSGQQTQSSHEGSDAGSTTGSFLMGNTKESTPEAKEDIIFDTVNTLREQRMMMVMNDVQFSFLYEVLREAYVEMYSPNRQARDRGYGGDADMGEPSPKIARTRGMSFVGAGELAQEEKREGDRKVVNAEAVATNRMIGRASEGEDPYAAVDPEVVRLEETKEDRAG